MYRQLQSQSREKYQEPRNHQSQVRSVLLEVDGDVPDQGESANTDTDPEFEVTDPESKVTDPEFAPSATLCLHNHE